MSVRVLFIMAVRSLLRDKKRTFLTMIGIIVGISAVITIVALGEGYKRDIVAKLNGNDSGKLTLDVTFLNKSNDITETHKDAFNMYDKELVKNIKGIEDVQLESSKDESIYTNIKANNELKENVEVVKNDSKFYNGLYGRKIDEFDKDNRVAVIGDTLAESIYKNSDKSIGRYIFIDNKGFKIVGVYDDSMDLDSQVIIDDNLYEKYFNGKRNIKKMTLTISDKVVQKDIIKEVEEKLNKRGSNRRMGTYSCIDVNGLSDAIGKIMSSLTIFISCIAGISLFIAGIGIMNMVYTTVSERTLEIGIKRALGAKKREISLEFILEGCVISVSGGILGYILGFIIAYILSKIFKVDVIPDIYTVSITMIISILTGVLSSILPAKKAANKNTIDILK